MTRTPSTGIRIIVPIFVTIMIASVPRTPRAVTKSPVLAVSSLAIIPLPPRFCVRYSPNGVRLP